MTNDESPVWAYFVLRPSSFVILSSLGVSLFVILSGTGGHRTHIVRFKRPVHYLVCHSPAFIGAVGVEPTPWSL
jgi:hypothetical protein